MGLHTVPISWTASTDAVNGYNVYRGPAGAEVAPALNGTTLITGTSYSDQVSPGVYSYVVTSVENGAESVHSNEVTATVPPFPPTNVTLGTIV
jgi:hypothetical protein